MKLNKSKEWILNLGSSNARHKCKLGEGVAGKQIAERDLGVLVDSRLSGSHQCLPGSEGKLHPGEHQTQHNQPVKEGIIPLCSALVQPFLEDCVHFWAPEFHDVKALECIQKRAVKQVTGL